MRILLIIFSLAIFFTSCNEKSASPAAKPTTSTVQSPKTTATEGQMIPGIPEAEFMDIYNQVDALDYIFYELPFSMSQNEVSAVKTNMTFVSKTSASPIPPKCNKPLGRKFFKAKGEIIAEADIYYSPECYFYIFMEGNTKKYANFITPDGVAFYQNIMRQVMVQQ